jgi:hypothetical protein
MDVEFGTPDTGGLGIGATSTSLLPIMAQGSASGSADPLENARVEKPERRREYPLYFKGPYVVFIKQKGPSLSHVTVARKLNENFKKSVKSIVKVNSTKIRVEMDSATSANKVMKMEFLSIYRVYIPAESVEIDGIVSISNDLTVEDIMKDGKGKFTHPGIPMVSVMHAFRYNKRGEGDNVIPLDTIRVTFSGTALPKWLWIYGLLVPVRIYNPQLMTCKKCLADHHTEKHCNNRTVCLKCKGAHLTSECKENYPWCSHCREHIVHQEGAECGALLVKTKRIVDRAKGRSRRSYAEALKSCETPLYQNRYSLLSQEEEDSETTDVERDLSAWSATMGVGKKRPNGSGGKSKGAISKRSRRTGSPDRGLGDVKVAGYKPPPNEPRNRRQTRNRGGGERESVSSPLGSILNVGAETIKSIISSLTSHFGVSPAVSSLITAFVFPLIDKMWPSVLSFISGLTENRLPSQNVGRNV